MISVKNTLCRKNEWFVFTIMMIVFIAFVSCIDETVSSQSEVSKETNWAPNVKYAVAYDEKKTVLQTTWPQGRVAGLSKSTTDNSEGLLIDYSNQRVETVIDDRGYVSMSTRYLEGGDAWMHMPPADYNDLQRNRPAKPKNYDPPVASEMRDGQAFLTTKSGNVIVLYTYNIQDYWIDPSQVDSVLGLIEIDEKSSANEKISKRYKHLSQKYGLTSKLNDFFVSLEINTNNRNEISAIKQVVDLRDGTVIREALVDHLGRVSEMSFIGYKEINGFKIEKYRTTFEMVDENGRFVKKYVRHTQRDNIEVIYRSN